MRNYNDEVAFSELSPIMDGRKLSADSRKIADEVIEKAMSVNSILSKHSVDSGRLSKIVEAAQFSESTMEFAENHSEALIQGSGLKLAENPNFSYVGNWTVAALELVIQEIGSSMEKDSILSLSFPDTPVRAYEVFVDRVAPNSGILPEFGGDSSNLPTIKPLDSFGLKYRPGLWAGRTSLTSKHLFYDRALGKDRLDERGVGQRVAYNSVNVLTMAYTRKKKLIADAIFNNGFIYAGQTVSSNIPNGNYIALSQPIGVLNNDGSVTYNTADPLYNPFIAITNIVNNPAFLKYRKYIKAIVVNGADLQAIMNHPAVKSLTNLLYTASASLNKTINIEVDGVVKELTGYFAPGFDIPIVADDDVWVGQDQYGNSDNSQQKFFIPRGRMFVLMDFPNQEGSLGGFHLTYNELDPNVENPVMGYFTGIFNRNLQNSEITNRIDIVGGFAGAPAVYRPEAIIIYTGLYSNVA